MGFFCYSVHSVTSLSTVPSQIQILCTLKTIYFKSLWRNRYVSAAVHHHCHHNESCQQSEVFFIIFYHVSMLGLVVYPFIWLLLDKSFARRIFAFRGPSGCRYGGHVGGCCASGFSWCLKASSGNGNGRNLQKTALPAVIPPGNAEKAEASWDQYRNIR